jgi:predicted transcriptional regulator
MDFDLFLTSPRWDILRIIAEKPSSPVEIAEKLKTTVSYVSQQLKLLDAANLLIKEKTGAAEKGKPRTLFGLSDELVYITVLTKSFSEKKLLYLSDYHKTILRIWFSLDSSNHYYAEKLFWKLEEDINEIDALFIETSSAIPKILIISDSKKLKIKIESFIKNLDNKIEPIFIIKNQLKKFSIDSLIPLHDPHKFFDELKGGYNLNG